MVIKHHFHCGYFCRYCGAFNIGAGHIQRRYTTDEEDRDLDTSVDIPSSQDGKRYMARTIESYEMLSRLANKDQKLAYYNAEKAGTSNYIVGECSACGKTQPWAETWKLRGSAAETGISCLGFVLVLIGYVTTAVLCGLCGELLWGVLCALVTSGVWALMHVAAERAGDKKRAPQFEARNEAIREAMKDSPYYKQSYPYIACKNDKLDVNDERALRMAAKLWPGKLRG